MAHPPLPKSMLNTGEMQKKDSRNGININLIMWSIINSLHTCEESLKYETGDKLCEVDIE